MQRIKTLLPNPEGQSDTSASENFESESCKSNLLDCIIKL